MCVPVSGQHVSEGCGEYPGATVASSHEPSDVDAGNLTQVLYEGPALNRRAISPAPFLHPGVQVEAKGRLAGLDPFLPPRGSLGIKLRRSDKDLYLLTHLRNLLVLC